MSTRCSVPTTIAPQDPGPSRAIATPRRAVLVAAIALSVLTVWMLRSLLPAVLLGAWLAAVTEPLSARLARRLGGRTRAASVLVMALMMALLGAAAVVIVPAAADASAAIRSALALVRGGQGMSAAAQALHGGAHGVAAAPGGDATPWFAIAREVAPLAEAAVATAASAVMQLLAFVVTAYYLAIDGRRLEAGIERVSPLGVENTRAFVREFVAVGRGIALSMGVAGALTSLALWVSFVATGAPRPFLLAAIAFVAATLPTGAHVVWIPVAATMLWKGRHAEAVALTVVGVVGIGGVIDHVVRPWLVRFGKLSLHPLLTFLGLFGGVVAFGAWGVFLGPLVVAMCSTALRMWAERPILARRSLVPGERVTQMPSAPTMMH